MELNDTKAGMQGLDKEEINKIIRDASEGSKFYQREIEKKKGLEDRVKKLQATRSKIPESDIRTAEKKMDALAAELENGRDLSRTLVHIDMDAFYAAVEMRDNPRSTSNYAARRFGVRAAMPGFIAKKLCPQLVIVPCRFKEYAAVSQEVREVFAQYDENYSMMSLDEGYLDLTEYLARRGSETKTHKRVRYGGDCVCKLPLADSNSDLTQLTSELDEICLKCLKKRIRYEDEIVFKGDKESVVAEIRFLIEQKTGLTASAGIAVNTRLAKVCSDRNKPNGQFILPSDLPSIQQFVHDLPIRKISGIGRISEEMLKALGVETCGDIFKQRGVISLLHSEISSRHLLKVSMGIGSSFISNERDRKSLSVERSFGEVSDPDELRRIMTKQCDSLAADLAEEEMKARTVTLKLKSVDFSIKTRSKSSLHPICSSNEIMNLANCILNKELSVGPLRLRLLGVRLSNLSAKGTGAKDLKAFLFNGSLGESSETEDEELNKLTKLRKAPKMETGNGPICPICQSAMAESADAPEEVLNRHVDDCLNQQAVREILEKEEMSQGTLLSPGGSTQRPKRRDDKVSSAAKKPKLHCKTAAGQVSLDRFLNAAPS